MNTTDDTDINICDYATGESLRKATLDEWHEYSKIVGPDAVSRLDAGATDGAPWGYPGRTVFFN